MIGANGDRDDDDDDKRKKRSAKIDKPQKSENKTKRLENPNANASEVEEVINTASVLKDTSGNYSRNTFESNEVHSRSKRQISGNPCVRGKAQRTTILYAVDSEDGKVVELFQDIGEFLMGAGISYFVFAN